MAFKVGPALTAFLLAKSFIWTPLWQAYQKQQQAFLQLLGEAHTHAAQQLCNALQNLVESGMNKGIDSYQLFRNLEKLIPLLCLDTCHHHVMNQVTAASSELLRMQACAMSARTSKILKAHVLLTDLARLLLGNPDVAEVFEETKVEIRQVSRLPSESWIRETYQNPKILEILLELSNFDPTARDRSDHHNPHKVIPSSHFYEDVHQSLEGIFAMANEIHETQRKLAAALSKHNTLLQSYDDTEHAKAADNWVEAERLRNKLLELSHLSHMYCDPFRDYTNRDIAKRAKRGTIPHIAVDIVSDGVVVDEDPILKQRVGTVRFVYHEEVLTKHAVDRWKRAMFRLLLLIGRIEARAARIQRRKDIAALFDAVGATDTKREEIESHIRNLYGAIHRRWKADGWIKILNPSTHYYKSPFADHRFGGWKKPTRKRRRLFMAHYNTFQFKSPRELTKEGTLAAVQMMETNEDALFTRTSRLNHELQDILDHAAENERHGKFDEAIADLKILLHRMSETEGINKVDYPPKAVSTIYSYLAYCYAFRGEHLEEAVQLAKDAMTIHDAWLPHLILGWCYHQQGKVSAAIEALEAAKEPATKEGSALLPLLHQVLGDAYRDAEKHPQAKQEWQWGWNRANDPNWKEQDKLTPFELEERAALHKELAERLSRQEQENAS